ncbi:MAG: tail-specific protease [Sphingobacteriia bacterium 35-40-8]|nr:MAG: tail-specific protease [Sphingobacteriia bacterium 35-40-8]
MKSRKGIVLSAIVLFAALFFAFKGIEYGKSDINITLRQRLVAAIGSLMEQEHYSPKPINDAFSKEVYKKYLNDLDGEKILFLQSDIKEFKKFETTIDDEIHGSAILFAPTVSTVFDKRIPELIGMYKEILSQPFDFSTEETAVLDGDKMDFAKDEKERKDRFRKLLKFLTLERYVDLQEVREKNKDTKDFVVKADTALEREARMKVMKIMDKKYDRIKGTFNEDQRFNAFLNTITNLMDPHTDYFPPIEKRAFDEEMSRRFYGIGAQLREDDAGIKIASVQTGGAAWKTGEVAANDVIVKVAQGKEEPVDVTGFATEDAVKLIRGNKGTEVRLTLKKLDGSIKVVTIIREEVSLDEALVRGAVIQNGADKIGYIYLPEFYADFEREDGNRCSEDVAKEVEKLKAENIKGIVLDIRNNGGGSLYEVVQMVGLFINQGPVVQVRDKEGKSSALNDKKAGAIYDGPLAVMVNELSASASEIFAAAIQDYKRGIIIGSSSTYGKGTVQKTVPFGKPIDFSSGRTEYGAVKLTFQKYYRINGGSVQLKGVTPDVVLPDAYEFYKIREKDNPASLPWDEITKVPYNTWNNADLTSVVNNENEKIAQNKSLNLLRDNLSWLSKNAEMPVNLNMQKYKDMQKQIKATVNQNNSLLKIKEEMAVEAMKVDYDKFYNNPDKVKGERYQAWLKSIKTDMYVDETVKMVSSLIHPQTATVLK